eukprot:Gb_35391 [translate_table: standard]
MAGSSSLKEYLKRYTSDAANEKAKSKSKKKRKPKNSVSAAGVRIVDQDTVWQKEIKDESSQDDSPDEKPQITEDIEVKRMRRLEEVRMRRPYLTVAGDGSGWVTISDTKNNGSHSSCLSPSRQNQQDLSHDRKAGHDLPDESLSPPRRDCSDAHQRDSLPAKQCNSDSSDEFRLANNRSCSLSPDSDYHNSLQSPVRENRSGSPNALPPRKVRHDSPDLSPPRKTQSGSPDLSPPRKSQKDKSAYRRDQKEFPFSHDSRYLSPAKVSENKDRDFSLPRKVRHDSPDLSPPRKPQRGSPDLSPPRKSQKDKSGYREDQKESSFRHDSHYSLPAKNSEIHDQDSSPPRRIRHDFFGRADVSLTRKAQSGCLDLSPPRRSQRNHSPHRKDRKDSIPSSRMSDLHHDQTLSEKHATDRLEANGEMPEGINAGLRTGRELKEEIDRKKKEELQRFSKMDPSVSGRGAETVYRDKQGKRLEGVDEFLKLQQGQPKPQDKPLEWGKGLAQKREAETRQAELELEKNKPFARSKDDPELDKMLKERVRWGDPMAHLVKKTSVEPVLENLAEDAKIKESGFIVPQDIPSHSWLKRGIDPPANRYGIKPGRHWDGVDRSNGFERESFKRQNDKRATEMEAYLWSVSDM